MQSSFFAPDIRRIRPLFISSQTSFINKVSSKVYYQGPNGSVFKRVMRLYDSKWDYVCKGNDLCVEMDTSGSKDSLLASRGA